MNLFFYLFSEKSVRTEEQNKKLIWSFLSHGYQKENFEKQLQNIIDGLVNLRSENRDGQTQLTDNIEKQLQNLSVETDLRNKAKDIQLKQILNDIVFIKNTINNNQELLGCITSNSSNTVSEELLGTEQLSRTIF